MLCIKHVLGQAFFIERPHLVAPRHPQAIETVKIEKLWPNHLFTVLSPPPNFDSSQQAGSSELFILSCNFRNDCLLRWRWLFYLLGFGRINRCDGKGPTFYEHATSSRVTRSADTSCADDECLDKPLVLGYNGLDQVRMNMNFRNQT